MADSIKERMTAGWRKIKLEGGTRLTRVRDLYRDASREAMTQLQTGSQEIRQIAQDSFTAIASDLQSSPETTAAPQALTPQLPELTTPAPVIPTPAVSATVAPAAVEPAPQPAVPETPLDNSPPSRTVSPQLLTALRVSYAVAKEGWQGVSGWYQQARLQAATEPQTPNPLEQKQAVWETKAGELGSQTARKEQQIRQRVKRFLQTAAERL